MKHAVLLLIRIAKRCFYNTPVHRWGFVNAVYRRLFHAAYPSGQLVDVPYLGHSFAVPTRDITILPSLLNGDYEPYEFEMMTRLASPDTVFADVGANIGLFTVIMGAAVGPQGRVYAFEPEPENFELLIRNLARNGISNVVAEQLAVGARSDTLTLHVERGSIGTHTLVAGLKEDVERRVTVQVTDLDSYFRGAQRWPDILKVDVEGYEPFVFRGAVETLARSRYVFFEFIRKDFEQQGFEVAELAAALQDFPSIYRINERSRTLDPFDLDDLDITPYTNLLVSKVPLLNL